MRFEWLLALTCTALPASTFLGCESPDRDYGGQGGEGGHDWGVASSSSASQGTGGTIDPCMAVTCPTGFACSPMGGTPQCCDGMGMCCNVGDSGCGMCTPNCAGKQCGSDGCSGTCPPGCSGSQSCDGAGQCVTACGPSCGSFCGGEGDRCGGTCPLQNQGAECQGIDLCKHGVCSGSSCVTVFQNEGAECMAIDQCEHGVCNAGNCVTVSQNEGSPCIQIYSPPIMCNPVCTSGLCDGPFCPTGYACQTSDSSWHCKPSPGAGCSGTPYCCGSGNPFCF